MDKKQDKLQQAIEALYEAKGVYIKIGKEPTRDDLKVVEGLDIAIEILEGYKNMGY